MNNKTRVQVCRRLKRSIQRDYNPVTAIKARDTRSATAAVKAWDADARDYTRKLKRLYHAMYVYNRLVNPSMQSPLSSRSNKGEIMLTARQRQQTTCLRSTDTNKGLCSKAYKPQPLDFVHGYIPVSIEKLHIPQPSRETLESYLVLFTPFK